MDLQNFHLAAYRDNIFSNLQTLAKTQSNYINGVYKIIFSLYGDINLIRNVEFLEFNMHFNIFVQSHASGEGYIKAIDYAQLYSNVLLEKLLEDQVVSAAEQLEIAIKHFEQSIYDVQFGSNRNVMLLNNALALIEETELRIIEMLENWLENNRQGNLEN